MRPGAPFPIPRSTPFARRNEALADCNISPCYFHGSWEVVTLAIADLRSVTYGPYLHPITHRRLACAGLATSRRTTRHLGGTNPTTITPRSQSKPQKAGPLEHALTQKEKPASKQANQPPCAAQRRAPAGSPPPKKKPAARPGRAMEIAGA